ncbi:MAG: hypothetical protein Q8N69_02305, partial [bacterium]|nr:hypothetical protein [bacterium]
MKKIIGAILLCLVFFSFANIVLAAERTGCPVPYKDGGGLVPCGNTTTCPCTLCDLFVLANNIVHMLLFRIVPVLAALLIAIGGIMMIYAYAGAGGPSTLEKAKALFKSVIIGLLIIYCAWLIVNLFLFTLGVTKWSGSKGQWWIIECGPVSSSPAPANT